MPKTRLGKWSVELIAAFFLLFVALRLLVASGQKGGATFFSNLILAIPGLGATFVGVLASFIGVIAMVKYKERSVLVFLATGIGLLVLLFVLGEFLSPH